MNYKSTKADSLGQLLNKLHGCKRRQLSPLSVKKPPHPTTASPFPFTPIQLLPPCFFTPIQLLPPCFSFTPIQLLSHPSPSHTFRVSLISFVLWVKNVNFLEAYVSWSCISRELHAESFPPFHTINPGQLISLNGFHSVGPRENRTPHLQDLTWEAGEKRKKEREKCEIGKQERIWVRVEDP